MKSSASSSVKGTLCGGFNGNSNCKFLHLQSFLEDSEFWQGAKEVQSLVQSAFIQGCAICPWAIKEFWNVYQVSCHWTCRCHHLLSRRKAVGNMTTLGKSGQVYLVFSLRLLVKETMGVLDTKTLRSCLTLFSTW